MDRSGTELIPQSAVGFRLSDRQERVLGLVSAGAAGRTVAWVRVIGKFDRDLLERSVEDVASVHESLRTAYRKVLGENGATMMTIAGEPQVQIRESVGDDADLVAMVREQSHASAYECVLNLILFTHTNQDVYLVVSAPRMGMDIQSADVFFRDLQRAYAARLNEVAWTSDAVVQYADFAQWQADQVAALTAEQRETAAERHAHIAALTPLHLPLEQRSSEHGHENVEWTLPTRLAQSLDSHRGRFKGGMRSVLLAGWLVALWHASGRPDSLGAYVTLPGRDRELATAIGQFEASTPIFVSISSGTTLAELLNSVDQQLERFECADNGFVETSKPRAVGIPGFAFSDFAEFPESGLTLSGLRVEPSDNAEKVGLWVQAIGGTIRVTLRYRALVMADGGAEALLVCLRAALHALDGDDSAAVSSLRMLDDDAAAALVETTHAVRSSDRPVGHWHRQVERTAQRYPNCIALRSDVRAWSFSELDQAANRLAHELIGRGVAARDLVGLSVERSDVAVVAMLAIAKAGAGYVPLDPHLPAKRRLAIMAAVGFRHVVAAAETASDFPADCNAILLDRDLSVCAHHSGEVPNLETADDDPVYVLFTSGSTGVPKGVLVGHGQLAAYLDGVLDRLALQGPVNSVALSTLGTDLGNTALFPPLISGGELRIVAPSVSADAQALAELLAAESFDLIKITPSHLEAVIAVAEQPRKLMPRQALVLGGEAMSWGTYHLLQGFLGDCRLYNHYGPTETTVGVLCQQVHDNHLAQLTSTVPLGRPLRHARAYILDPHRWPVPIGVTGELWIGGDTVSQGYLAATADTQERFRDDPFNPASGARMYRTGDRARMLSDRSIEFLGRIDRQIKIRGFRVEPGEIEAVMRQHPRVMGSMVVPAGEGTAVHLVGYLIDAEGGRESAEWLREFLAERLPEYMIPAHLITLDAFPLTGTGKIDASRLPAPRTYHPRSRPMVEPRTATERGVAQVVAQLLLLNQVGANDNFFESGGHSLLASQLVVKLRHEFPVKVKLRHIFQRPVVSQLAELIDGLLEEKFGGNHG